MAHYLYTPESGGQPSNLELVSRDKADYDEAIGKILDYAVSLRKNGDISVDNIREILNADPKSLPVGLFNILLGPDQIVVSSDHGLEIDIHEGEYTTEVDDEDPEDYPKPIDTFVTNYYKITTPLNVRQEDDSDSHLQRMVRKNEFTHYAFQKMVVFNEDGSSKVIGDGDVEHASLGHINHETGQFVPVLTVLNIDHPVRELIEKQKAEALIAA